MPLAKATRPRKEDIFDAALECFNNKGYYTTTIDDIALKAGITKGGIYYYFDSKKALFIELFHHKVIKFFDRITVENQHHEDPLELLQALIKKAEHDLRENFDIYKFCIEFITVSVREADIKQEVTSFFQERIKVFTEIVEKGIAAGRLKPIEPRSVAWNINFLALGFLLTYLATDISFDPIGKHPINLDVLLNGIIKQQ